MDKHKTNIAWVLIWIACGLISVPVMKGCMWEAHGGAGWTEAERMGAGQVAWAAAFLGPAILLVSGVHAIAYKYLPMMEFPEREVQADPERRRTF